MDRETLLHARIRDRITAEGTAGWLLDGSGRKRYVQAISFRDYMAECLYAEGLGYYRDGAVRVGRKGDFYTSSGIGSLMGDMLADYLNKHALAAGNPLYIMEWGAGTGRLGLQMLARWRLMGMQGSRLPVYRMVDSSRSHLKAAYQAAAEEGLAEHIRLLEPDEAWEHLREAGQGAVVIANELLDAFPVHRIIQLGGKLKELGAAVSDSGNTDPFRECVLEDIRPEVEQAVLWHELELREHQRAELNVEGMKWLQRLCRVLGSGMIILIDYGAEAEELTGPHRMNGTLLCYKRHVAHDNPYRDPGSQDITAHVNFTAVRKAAESEGWQVAEYCSQQQFLIRAGILDELREHDNPDPFCPEARRNRAVRQLLLSDGMSERFQVMVLRKNERGAV
ncbi:SAM-dependent methyltransferase [Paenibacillus sambharensis]|uniref:SAM-dependent methyltransferase n=1 Tax=Paenibacillus sambharensis TaxID=1803190 RepID=A0A2W1L3H4_9BACL|nr:SAM-dependent methyltransferase [Paenibacillus sambharensis]PZD93906.1 SAM-dependent methyltransferase [Paenibacillus sambharensis]